MGYSRNQVHKQEYPQRPTSYHHPSILYTSEADHVSKKPMDLATKISGFVTRCSNFPSQSKTPRKQYHNSTISKMRSSHHQRKLQLYWIQDPTSTSTFNGKIKVSKYILFYQ
ncbi:hypothetical protein TNCT_136661 [Trichonephila clavata]|uniref:Uncharacterized protein n=1 Tax=Trichonephila clavata TaxID=2740835 RepID=A0A8X6KBK3_TRICU|nr:hypothetical protein TNCT_136661 [Trichonephila clavata]